MEMYAVCKLLAQFHQQDKAKAEGRWIFYESQFTDEENQQITENAKRIRQALREANGKTWGEALTALEAVVPGTFIGFKLQDRILARCKANKINFR